MPAAGSLICPAAAVCLGCGSVRGVLNELPLCLPCARKLVCERFRAERVCPRCLSVMRPGKACPVCSRDREGLILRTYSPYRYRGVARKLILRLKFGGDTRAASLLAPAMADTLGEYRPDVLIPVPLNRRRERDRGFNQAELLARLVGASAGIPCMNALVRPRCTKRQSSLKTPAERGRNVLDAFKPAPGAVVSGMSVLLVDDVRTSGATALACADVLKKAGAAEICLLVAAVAPGAGRRLRRTVKRS